MGSWDRARSQRNGPQVLAKLPRMGALRPERRRMAHKIARLPEKYVMPAVHMLHEPVQMEQMVRSVKPCIENEHVDEDLLDGLEQGEFVLPACPVAVVGSVRVDFPQPDDSVKDDEKEGTQTQGDLLFGVLNPQLSLGERVRILEEGPNNEIRCIVSKSDEQESPAKLAETADWQHTDEWILNWGDMGDSMSLHQADDCFLNGLIRHLKF